MSTERLSYLAYSKYSIFRLHLVKMKSHTSLNLTQKCGTSVCRAFKCHTKGGAQTVKPTLLKVANKDRG